MNIPTPQDLAQIVRKGTLDDVLALLDAGLGRERPAELGLGLAMASFLGRREIVRELVRRGAPLNLPDGLADASPIAMAVKGGQTKTVRLLISYGARVPPGLDTGLTHEEYAEAVAKAKARRHAARKSKAKSAQSPSAAVAAEKPAPLVTPQPTPVPAPQPTASPPEVTMRAPMPATASAAVSPEFTYTPPPAPTAPPPRQLGSIVEEIEIEACFGLDTNVLETDLARLGLVETPTSDQG